MIKTWLQFIKESVEYWLEPTDINYAFISLKDEGYEIKVDKAVFTDMKDNSGRLEWLDPKNDIISLKNEYYFGYRIFIGKSSEKTGDLTLDFQSALKYLESEGYIIQDVWDEDGNTSPYNVHFYKGSIITWIPETPGKTFTTKQEDMVDGDLYISSVGLVVYCHQPDKIEITPKDLAEIYHWSDYTTDSVDNIYCEFDIEDMADMMLSSKSSWKDTLVNGIDEGNYESHYYQPEIDSLFRYNLRGENPKLAIKALIKEFGSLENLIEESDNEDLEGKSEEEVIEYLLKERYHETLKNLCKDSEIIGDIRQTIADWEVQAHVDRNQEELEKAFDKIIEREGIEYTKERKEGKRYFYRKIPGTDRKEKVYYDEIVWFYKLKFEERWITDYDKALYGYSLGNVFGEWASECYFDNQLNPYFSDYGDCDDVALNKEIEAILKHYLKE
jgi:hypothetical protein